MGLTSNPSQGQTISRENLNAIRRSAANGNPSLLQTFDTLKQEVVLVDLSNPENAKAISQSMKSQPAEID